MQPSKRGGRTPRNPEKNAWNMKKVNPETNQTKSSTEEKFQEAQKKLQAAVQRYAKDYESSSSEDELESENVIGTILKKYTEAGGKSAYLGRTQAFLEESFLSGGVTCLICIASVKRLDKIWSCTNCYTAFHLTCIERWSKDSVTQLKQVLIEQNKDASNVTWGCPKCRFEYEPNKIPHDYLCFCGKTTNPKFQPWLVPHSCGETCKKALKPLCGHECILLCHPGPCPPCPKSVNTTCYCGRKPPRTQRCSNKFWSCDLKCTKILSCGRHPCGKACHPGECLPCSKQSKQKCVCGSETMVRKCATPTWHCTKVCGRPLACGNHKCPIACHVGPCEQCELSKPRTCPCGKSQFRLPCPMETPTCGDTCAKLLECQMHLCNQRCHKDKCGDCLELVMKTCRCGLHTKEILCKKEYLCETKCKLMRDCMKHACNKKCCVGNCPPCEKPCARMLSCGIHKCASICHRGPCYPCTLTTVVKCRCTLTTVTVPCGRKAKKRPPKCNKPCRIPPDCNHEHRDPHTCHFGECPPCKQICNQERPECGHRCPEKCHDYVLVKLEAQKASVPWEERGPVLERRRLPCPLCKVQVPVTCIGGHETWMWPCFDVRKMSCERPCGLPLPCTNHTCSFACHEVEYGEPGAKCGLNCEVCERPCARERPKECEHTCPNPCHPGDCPQCQHILRLKCHCGLNQCFIKCCEWTSGNEVQRRSVQSCGNQCPRNYECGHRCKALCHSGYCPNPELCKSKVKLTCKCKRIKKTFSCHLVQANEAVVDCDPICQQQKEENRKLQELQMEEKRKEEEMKNAKELEEFQRKFQKKKKYKEKRINVDVDENRLWKKLIYIIPLLLATVLCIYLLK